MNDLVPYTPGDNRPYDEQMRDALEKALTIQGTVINDLESAITCIIQMQRAMNMTGTPNPHQATAEYLARKYKMVRETGAESERNSRKLLEAKRPLLTDGEVLEITKGDDVPLCNNSCAGCDLCGVVLDAEVVDD